MTLTFWNNYINEINPRDERITSQQSPENLTERLQWYKVITGATDGYQ